LLALGKEPWIFKDLEYQLNMYHQQWQAYQQKQIFEKMAGKMPGKKMKEKEKNHRNHQNSNGGRSRTSQGIPAEEDAEDAEEAVKEAAEEETTVTI
jgi:hypothetical protein